MTIDIEQTNFFVFSWFGASVDQIETYLRSDDFTKTNNVTVSCPKVLKINFLFQYNPNPKLAYFFPLNGGTCMITNLQDGWNTLFRNITEALSIDGYHFVLSSELTKTPYNCMQLIRSGTLERVVYVMKDGKRWVFYGNGMPLWFEETDAYKKRLKKERVTKELLLKYGMELKIILHKKINLETATKYLQLSSAVSN